MNATQEAALVPPAKKTAICICEMQCISAYTAAVRLGQCSRRVTW